jgi:hypothetical protein
LHDSLTVHFGRAPGTAFLQKMLQSVLRRPPPRSADDPRARFARHRSHIVFCDTAHNGAERVYANAHENFLLAAAKLHRYVRAWGVRPEGMAPFLLSAHARLSARLTAR